MVYPRDDNWSELVSLFPTMGGSRQIFDLNVETTAVSCGSGVPIMTVDSIRGDTELEPFYAAMSHGELHDYWTRKNVDSIDGYPTRIFAD
ncbi:MAG: hypothetical protein ACR2QO_25035 [Acidimicrobiales bacterium]